MAELTLGKLTREPPHDIWANEAKDFTPWLAKNISLLNEVLGLELEIEQREAPVGAFAVDLFGKEVGTGRPVIIENQLEKTDHTHLGQLLTYAAGLDAGIVIWVSPDVRDEHREAIHWLNGQTGDAVAFFAVELEMLRIDGSLPAPRFNVVAEPSGFQRAISGGRNQADRPWSGVSEVLQGLGGTPAQRTPRIRVYPARSHPLRQLDDFRRRPLWIRTVGGIHRRGWSSHRACDHNRGQGTEQGRLRSVACPDRGDRTRAW